MSSSRLRGVATLVSFETSEHKQCTDVLNIFVNIMMAYPWCHTIGQITRFKMNGFHHLCSSRFVQRSVNKPGHWPDLSKWLCVAVVTGCR